MAVGCPTVEAITPPVTAARTPEVQVLPTKVGSIRTQALEISTVHTNSLQGPPPSSVAGWKNMQKCGSNERKADRSGSLDHSPGKRRERIRLSVHRE